WVADGERMNPPPQQCAFAHMPGKQSYGLGAAAPDPASMGLAAPVFPPPCVLRGRGKCSPCTPSQAATAPCHLPAPCPIAQRSPTVTRASPLPMTTTREGLQTVPHDWRARICARDSPE